MIFIEVCVGSSCHIKGAPRIVELLQEKIEKNKLEDEIILTGAFCAGRCNRIGVTVSNKIGKAVVRNKIRRRLREIYRLREDKLCRGTDLVIVARGKSAQATYAQLERAFEKACKQLGILSTESGQEK